MAYATKTSVSIERSQGEIKKILTKYGASAYALMENENKAMVMFELQSRRIMFKLPLPEKPTRTTGVELKKHDQLCRSKWRSLALCIKAKLESVESQILTFEEAFLAHIMLPNGKTFGDIAIPEIATSYENKKMPPLLGMR